MRISSRMLTAVRATDECSRMKANAREREKEGVKGEKSQREREREHEWVRVCENGLVRTGDREKECSLWIFLLNFQVWWLPSKQLINKHKHKWKNYPDHFFMLQLLKTRRMQGIFLPFHLRFVLKSLKRNCRYYCADKAFKIAMYLTSCKYVPFFILCIHIFFSVDVRVPTEMNYIELLIYSPNCEEKTRKLPTRTNRSL